MQPNQQQTYVTTQPQQQVQVVQQAQIEGQPKYQVSDVYEVPEQTQYKVFQGQQQQLQNSFVSQPQTYQSQPAQALHMKSQSSQQGSPQTFYTENRSQPVQQWQQMPQQTQQYVTIAQPVQPQVVTPQPQQPQQVQYVQQTPQPMQTVQPQVQQPQNVVYTQVPTQQIVTIPVQQVQQQPEYVEQAPIVPQQQQQVYQSFRPPYADDNIRTGFSGVYMKPQEAQSTQPPKFVYYQQTPVESQVAPQSVQRFEQKIQVPVKQEYEDIIIEPTETDINQSDLDEATVVGTQNNIRRQTQQQLADRDNIVSPRRLTFQATQRRPAQIQQVGNPQEQISPRVHVERQDYQPPHTRIQQEVQRRQQPIVQEQVVEENVNVYPEQFLTPAEKQSNLSQNEWKSIQKRIDQEYERKLKQVGDDALEKLKMFQMEHQQLLSKTQYLIDQTPQPQYQEQRIVEHVEQPQVVRSVAESVQVQQEGNQWRNYTKASDVQLVRNFHTEFKQVIDFGMNHAGELYLVDILKRLNLLPYGDTLPTKDHERDLYNLLVNSKDNLLIKSDLEHEQLGQTSVQDIEGDLTRNLFKVCCAILNLGGSQRDHNVLDERLLISYLGSINYSSQDQEVTPGAPQSTLSDELGLIPVPQHVKEQGQASGFQYREEEMVTVSGYTLRDQLATLKSLINRPSYALSDRHMRMISDAFQNFANSRDQHLDLNSRQQQVDVVSTGVRTVSPRTYQQQPQQQPIQEQRYVEEKRYVQQPVEQRVADPRFSAKGPGRTFNPDIEHQKTIDQQVMQSRQVFKTPQYANSEVAQKQGPVRATYYNQAAQVLPHQAPPKQFNTAAKQTRYLAPQQQVQQFTTQQRPIQSQAVLYDRTREVSPQISVELRGNNERLRQQQNRYYDDGQHPIRQQRPAVNDVEEPRPAQLQAFEGQRPADAQQLSFGTSSRARPVNTDTRNRSVPRTSYQPVTTQVPTQQTAQRRIRADKSDPISPRNEGTYQYRQGNQQNRVTQQRTRDVQNRVRSQDYNVQYDEDPICVLKVELDGGENVQHLTVFEGDHPETIVDNFARKFNLSDNAKLRLLAQINTQIGA